MLAMTRDWPADAVAVVLSYGAGPVDACVQSLRSAGVPDDLLVVVHNPNSESPACPDLPGAHEVIDRPVNDGYGPGMNAGLRVARERGARYGLLCTHDALVGAETVHRLVEVLRDDMSIAVAAPTLAGHDGRTFTAGGWSRRGRAGHLEPVGTGVRSVDWVDGSVMLVRLSAGLVFREDFFLYWEDVDLCLRARDQGWGVVCHQGLTATSVPGNVGARSDLYTYLRWRNSALTARSTRAGGSPTAVTWAALLSLGGAVIHSPPHRWVHEARLRWSALRDARQGRSGTPASA